ncbi:MAG: DNA polymerase III subunit alpha, partial [Candidatus Adiutrix sp.]
ITLDEAIKEEPQIKLIAKGDLRVAQLLDYARLLENLPRHASIHAAGVVIGDKPLMEHLPLYCDPSQDEVNGEKPGVVTQFDMKGVESIGLIKFDFLGLKTLTLIKQCLSLIEMRGLKVNLPQLEFDDEKTYQLLARGDSTGVFQLESSGMRGILLKLKPNCIEDLMGLVALYRPGPLKSGMVDTFIDGKHGRGQTSYELPELEPILKETYGVILYQEQVMRISQVLANYTLGEADLLRRAMGKKKPEEMAKQKARFMAGAAENGHDQKKADRIFDLMANFAEYGFNKSHSAAYAIVAYHTAYLKANYPVEFMAALLSAERDNQDKVVRLISESRSAGLLVLPPDVNDSGYKFTVAEGVIRFGLGAVKGLGQAAIEAIMEAREEGPFTSLFDFCERVDTQKVNRRVIESLIKCGAFDKSGGAERAVMLLAVDEALDASARAQRDRRDGQSSMFDLLAEVQGGPAALNWPKAEPLRENVRLAFEKEILGFFLTGHPLARYEMELSVVSNVTAENVPKKADKSEVRIGGVVAKVQGKVGKNGKKFAYVTLEDLTGSVELLVWSDTYEKADALLVQDQVVLIVGQVDAGERGGQANIKIIAKEVISLTDAVERRTRTVSFKILREDLSPSCLHFLKDICDTHPGSADAFLHLVDRFGVSIYKLSKKLKPCRELIENVRHHLGPQGLELR